MVDRIERRINGGARRHEQRRIHGERVAAAIVSTACRAGCAADAVRVKAGEPRIRATSQWIDRRGSMHRGTIALEFKQLKPLVRNLAMTIQWNRLAL